MPMDLKRPLLSFSIFAIIIGCNGGEMGEKKELTSGLNNVPASAFDKLAQKKIFFGHQSVGNNIIDGIRDIIQTNPKIKLNIEETVETSDFEAGVFGHSNIGKNHDPKSKIDAFTDLMEKGLGPRLDIAFLKFCFVDIDSQTDVPKLFAYYKSAISILNEKYPHTTFVHFTVPLLRKTKPTFIGRIKALLGKKDGFFADENNIARNNFNQLLRNEYDGRFPVFDLAQIESTYPDGTRETFLNERKTFYSLVPEYTDDGGHLNKTGRKIIAEHLLLFLLNL